MPATFWFGTHLSVSAARRQPVKFTSWDENRAVRKLMKVEIRRLMRQEMESLEIKANDPSRIDGKFKRKFLPLDDVWVVSRVEFPSLAGFTARPSKLCKQILDP